MNLVRETAFFKHMKKPVLVTENLSYHFPKGVPLFESLDLEIPDGSCFGLLGRNGAGKTTLMKLVCGLLTRSGDSVRWWGQEFRENKLGIYRKIGLLIGEPRLYNHLSGTENLAIYSTYRKLDSRSIPDMLDRVGLSKQASKKVRHYSTGMRQRLGIALALLHRPDFLILDEPTNGLDPQGIAEVRGLILELREEHTLLVSSHLLSEVEQTSTHLAVLEEGKLLFQGSMEALRSRKRSAGFSLLVETRPETAWPDGIRLPAESLGAGKFRISLTEREQIPPLIDRLRESGLSLFQFRIEEPDLEASFLDLFQKEEV